MMDSASPDETLLPIRCPSCGQRFKVTHDLLGRTVECGSCEHRFKIEEEVIVTSKKFYPGEKKKPSLAGFQRQPHAPDGSELPPVPMHDPGNDVHARIEPFAPQRLIAGLAGVCLMALVALLLIFGTKSGMLFDGMVRDKRLVLSGFAALLGGGLLVYANPKARFRALAVAVLLSGGLLYLPFLKDEVSLPIIKAETSFTYDTPPPVVDEKTAGEKLMALREEIGMDPLDKERARLGNLGGGMNVYGLWMHNLPGANKYIIRDYILRTTGSDKMNSIMYPRGSDSYLMILSGTTSSLEDIARLISPFGQVEKIHPELGVVQVRVDNDKFIEGPADKLLDKNDPAFYELNKRELESIDFDRIKRAVQRLATAEPKLYRTDITKRLISLLNQDGVTFTGELSQALITWSDTPGPAGAEAEKALERLFNAKQEIPQPLIELLAHEKRTAAIPILHQLWLQDATRWENSYAEMGPAVEPTILGMYAETKGSMRHSATRILSKVGGPASIQALEAAKSNANSELKVLIEDAIKRIRERQGR